MAEPRALGAGGLIVPELAALPATALWTLQDRASEARRPDGVVDDPEALRLLNAIRHPFGRRGVAGGAIGLRAAAMDRLLRRWLQRHPDGTVVSLGEGLETQSRRVENGRRRWLTVDLPDAIALRDELLPERARHRHWAGSALDQGWMAEVDPRAGVMVIAQGLLMYLPPEQVRALLAGIAARFPGAELVFDTVPRWVGRFSRRGMMRSRTLRFPPMHWGINTDEIAPTLLSWLPRGTRVTVRPFAMPRGLPLVLAGAARAMPLLRERLPALVHVVLP